MMMTILLRLLVIGVAWLVAMQMLLSGKNTSWRVIFAASALVGFWVAKSRTINVDGRSVRMSTPEYFKWIKEYGAFGSSDRYKRIVTDPNVPVPEKLSMQWKLWKVILADYSLEIGVVLLLSVLAAGYAARDSDILVISPMSLITGHLMGWGSGLIWLSVIIRLGRRAFLGK